MLTLRPSLFFGTLLMIGLVVLLVWIVRRNWGPTRRAPVYASFTGVVLLLVILTLPPVAYRSAEETCGAPRSWSPGTPSPRRTRGGIAERVSWRTNTWCASSAGRPGPSAWAWGCWWRSPPQPRSRSRGGGHHDSGTLVTARVGRAL